MNVSAGPMKEADVERFWSKVEKTEACWLWHGTITTTGYGHFWLNGKNRKSHRVAYEMENGPIQNDLPLDHLCRNPPCVRPSHLEPVTTAENALRGNNGLLEKSRTHCPKGHPYDEKNTWMKKDRNGRKSRSCKTCNGDRVREWKAVKRLEKRMSTCA